jgi:exopolyphosphatase/guanosine-5'-triphosphate,3'-diphosphate pyrophosphatase
VALLAQYHRRGTPRAGTLSALFSDEDHRALPMLAGMLRLSEFLERGRSQVVRAVRCHLDLPNGWLQIEALEAGDARMELWEASRNLDVLQRALALHVELVSGVWLGEQ